MSTVTLLIGDAGTGKTARLRPIVTDEHDHSDTVIVQSGPDPDGEEYPLALHVQRIPAPDSTWPTAQQWKDLVPEILKQAAKAQTLVLDAQFEDEDDPLLTAIPALVARARERGQRLFLTCRPSAVPFLHEAGVSAMVNTVEVTAPPKMLMHRQSVEAFVAEVMI